MKGQILICTAIMLNDHSNPYIESTTVLSDTCPVMLTGKGQLAYTTTTREVQDVPSFFKFMLAFRVHSHIIILYNN